MTTNHLTLDRRSFVRNAALMGAGVAVAAGASRALADEAPADSAAADAAPAGGAPAGAPGGSASTASSTDVSHVPAVGEYPLGVPAGTPEGLDWMAVPEPITDIAEEYTADVVIVGAGIAGLAAARSATEEGASVIVVEACDTWQTRGQDIGTINSTVQKENDLECTEEDIQKELANEENPADIREKWESSNRMAELRKICRHSKATRWLVQTAEVTVVEDSAE